MLAWKSSTARNPEARATSAHPLEEAASAFSRWRQTFRPTALGFIALALAVVIWGYGYKLSLYFTAPDSQDEIPAAKLWIEHRNGYSVEFRVTAERQFLRDQHWHSTSMLATAQLPDLVSIWSAFVPAVPPAAALAFFHSGAQLRAPPSSSLC